MSVLPDERELLASLKRVCNQAPDFALEFMAGGLSIDAEIAYAHRLVDVAEGILRHATARRQFVIDGHATTFTLDPEPPPMRELEP
jgi:hypothetical protein